MKKIFLSLILMVLACFCFSFRGTWFRGTSTAAAGAADSEYITITFDTGKALSGNSISFADSAKFGVLTADTATITYVTFQILTIDSILDTVIVTNRIRERTTNAGITFYDSIQGENNNLAIADTVDALRAKIDSLIGSVKVKDSMYVNIMRAVTGNKIFLRDSLDALRAEIDSITNAVIFKSTPLLDSFAALSGNRTDSRDTLGMKRAVIDSIINAVIFKLTPLMDSMASLTGNRLDLRRTDSLGVNRVTIDSIVNAIIFKLTPLMDSAASLTGSRWDLRRTDTAGFNRVSFDSATAAALFKKTISMIEVNNDSLGASGTVDWTAGNRQKIFLNTVGATIIFTAPQSPSVLTLVLIQNGAGSKTITTWPNTVKWPSGVAPTLTTTASAVDIVSFYYNGTNYYAQAALDMK